MLEGNRIQTMKGIRKNVMTTTAMTTKDANRAATAGMETIQADTEVIEMESVKESMASTSVTLVVAMVAATEGATEVIQVTATVATADTAGITDPNATLQSSRKFQCLCLFLSNQTMAALLTMTSTTDPHTLQQVVSNNLLSITAPIFSCLSPR